ncbi:MAG: DNA/RNA non-specific endonuclease, partial [Eubacterium sp.]|nr:DNA/RNA non-specific endonuclease [Eubacterium sp.]
MPYAVVHDNKAFLPDDSIVPEPFEYYGELDSLGRATGCIATLCQELMPTEERKSIGSVKPSGWHTVKYDGIDGNYLYNRCHLIGFQLSGQNANECNLVTGTRYMNVEGMLPFENMLADFIRSTNMHVAYTALPVFNGNDLLCSGILLEAKSVEDNGAGLEFCVYVYNVQPGILIDYATGESEGPEYTGSGTAAEQQSSGSGEAAAADDIITDDAAAGMAEMTA